MKPVRSSRSTPRPLDDAPTSPKGMLARIERWARTTRSGDLSEVPGLSDSNPVWPQVTSTRDNCLGTKCPELSRCHVALARRAALDADIVIVNHHLLLADLALKEDGFGDILGSADAVILDEAHQIPDLATQFFGANVSSRRIENLLKDGQAELNAHLSRVSSQSEAGAAAADIGEALRAGGTVNTTTDRVATPAGGTLFLERDGFSPERVGERRRGNTADLAGQVGSAR